MVKSCAKSTIPYSDLLSLYKVNNRNSKNTRKISETYSKVTQKAPKRRH